VVEGSKGLWGVRTVATAPCGWGAAPVPRKPTTVKKKHLRGNRPALCYLPTPLLTYCGRSVDYGRYVKDAKPGQ